MTSLPFYVFYASWKTFYFPLSNYIRNYLKLTEIKSKFCWKMWISYWLDFKGHCREVWEVNSELTWHEWIGFKISLKLFLNFCSIQNNDNLIVFVFLRLWQKTPKKTHFCTWRKRPMEEFLWKGFLKICAKITQAEKQLIEINPHGSSSVNLIHIFRTPFSKNTFEGLLQHLVLWSFKYLLW